MSQTGVSQSAGQPEPAIILENLVKFFGRFAALRDISASFAPGRLYVIVGDNGAGKSTLLRIVAGLMAAQPGQLHASRLRFDQSGRSSCRLHGTRAAAL